MENKIEEQDNRISYEKFIEQYPIIPQSFLQQLTEKFSEFGLTFEYLPPYILIKTSHHIMIDIKMYDLLKIFENYMNDVYPKAHIEIVPKHFYYIVKYEENLMIAKNGKDDALLFIGKFNTGEIILLTHINKATQNKFMYIRLLQNILMLINSKFKKKNT